MTTSAKSPDYHSILIKNETISSTVYLFVYPSWDSLCWISYKTKSIPAKRSYFYTSTSSFKYELRIKTGMVKRKIILHPSLWTKNERLLITESGEVVENDLSECPQELLLCARQNNKDDVTRTTEEGRDLYVILDIDIKEVRKKSKEEQDAMIKKAYHKKMLLYHPDRNPDVADSSICQEIIMAYSILGDREKRARYHDITDYNGGWLSISRWKALFKPEAHGSGETLKRIGLLFFSAGLTACGVFLSAMVPGLPVLVGIGSAVLGSATVGAGINGAITLVDFETINKGVNFDKVLKSCAIGGCFGVLAGGSALGIAASSVGEICLPLGRMVVSGQLVKLAATGTTAGALSSVSSDVNKVVVEGKDVSLKKAAGNAIKGAVIGGVAGAAGGMFTKGVSKASAAAEKVEGKGIKKAGKLLVGKAVKHADLLGKAAEKTGKEALNYGVTVAEEKLQTQPEKKVITAGRTITYICNEPYFSRMIVEYSDKEGKNRSITVEESGSKVEMPAYARHIKVRFQNQRFIGTWCDVKKYDRKKKCWCKPTKPHVFTFPEPVTRTFTLEGSLYYVAVMKITNEWHKELDIME